MKKFLPDVKYILFAEDDEDFFFFFKSALLSISKNINLLRTPNGVMLLSLIETSIQPDFIFLDINMPFKDGIACLEEIRNRSRHHSTRVIMCSASNNEDEINVCYNSGADFYFVKPSRYLTLVQQFEKLFEKCNSYKNVQPPREEFVLN